MKIKIDDGIIFVEYETNFINPHWVYKNLSIEERKKSVIKFFKEFGKIAVINNGSDDQAQFMEGINISFTEMKDDELFTSITKTEKITYYCIIYEMMYNYIMGYKEDIRLLNEHIGNLKNPKTSINLSQLDEYENPSNKEYIEKRVKLLEADMMTYQENKELVECRFEETKQNIICLIPDNLTIKFYINDRNFFIKRMDVNLEMSIANTKKMKSSYGLYDYNNWFIDGIKDIN